MLNKHSNCTAENLTEEKEADAAGLCEQIQAVRNWKKAADETELYGYLGRAIFPAFKGNQDVSAGMVYYGEWADDLKDGSWKEYVHMCNVSTASGRTI